MLCISAVGMQVLIISILFLGFWLFIKGLCIILIVLVLILSGYLLPVCEVINQKHSLILLRGSCDFLCTVSELWVPDFFVHTPIFCVLPLLLVLNLAFTSKSSKSALNFL